MECGSLMCVPYQQPVPEAKLQPKNQPNVGGIVGLTCERQPAKVRAACAAKRSIRSSSAKAGLSRR